VTISGVAPKRADVVEFSERLKKEPWIATLDVPISSLVKEQDVPFSMVLRTIDVPYLEEQPR
jgi:hypothetical protein